MEKEVLKSKKNIIMIISGTLLVIASLFYGINAYVNSKVDSQIMTYLVASDIQTYAPVFSSSSRRCGKFNYECAEQAMKTVGFFDKIRFINNKSECFEDNVRQSIKNNENFIKVFVSCTLFINRF